VLELARVMATRQFDATIVFMAVAGEEQGLYGSNHFADAAKAAGTDIEGMLNNDIVGNTRGDQGVSRPNVIRLFAEGVPTSETPQQASTRMSVGGENDSTSRQLARYVEEVAEPTLRGVDVQIMYRRDRFLRSGDQVPFLENGYPAVRFTEPDEDYTHEHQNVRVENGIQYGDLPQFVDYRYIARVTAPVNGLALLNLARAPVAPKNTRIITATLGNDTVLRWDANPEPDVKGYEIVWRLTDESRWTHTIPVGNVTTYTAKGMAPDNFFFGVRAIDKDGYRSPVAFPVPASR
jgi:Zn-dependent M28 family amino/carboxypeptidase